MSNIIGLTAGPLPGLVEHARDLAETSTEVEIASLSTGLLVLLVVIWSVVGDLIVHRTQFLNEASVACLLGLVTALVLLLAVFIKSNNTWQVLVETQLLQFSTAAFFTYLLPPVIFNAGLSVEKQRFFHNLPSILSFGVLGTIAAFVMLSLSIHWLTHIELQDCLAIGAIFSATDSVATLQVLDPGSQPLLFSLVFGEGVMNDATSVVLLRAVTQLCAKHCPAMTAGVAGSLLMTFAYLFCASLALGSVVGLGIALLMKQWRCKGPHQEVALIGLLAYLGYLGAELLGLSGILAIFCCGIAVSHYALCNISAEGRATTMTVFKMLSYVSEGIIFIYVGMDALDPSKWRQAYAGKASWLFVVLVAVLALSRAAFVVPLSLAHNCWAAERISGRDIIIIWWAGLVRGAVSVALVYYQFDLSGGKGASTRSTLIVTTLMVVLFCITVLGAATRPLLSALMRVHEPRQLVQAMQLLRLDRQPSANGYGRITSSDDVGDDWEDSQPTDHPPPRWGSKASGALSRLWRGPARLLFANRKRRAEQRSWAIHKKNDGKNMRRTDQEETPLVLRIESSISSARSTGHHTPVGSSRIANLAQDPPPDGQTAGPPEQLLRSSSAESATVSRLVSATASQCTSTWVNSAVSGPELTGTTGQHGSGSPLAWANSAVHGPESTGTTGQPAAVHGGGSPQVGSPSGRRGRGLDALWKEFDRRYMQPTFGGTGGEGYALLGSEGGAPAHEAAGSH